MYADLENASKSTSLKVLHFYVCLRIRIIYTLLQLSSG